MPSLKSAKFHYDLIMTKIQYYRITGDPLISQTAGKLFSFYHDNERRILMTKLVYKHQIQNKHAV